MMSMAAISALIDNTTFNQEETLRLVLFLDIEIVMCLLRGALLRFGLLLSSLSLEEDSGEYSSLSFSLREA